MVATKDASRRFMIETPSNPLNTMVDLKLCARIAERHLQLAAIAPAYSNLRTTTLLGPVLPSSRFPLRPTVV